MADGGLVLHHDEHPVLHHDEYPPLHHDHGGIDINQRTDDDGSARVDYHELLAGNDYFISPGDFYHDDRSPNYVIELVDLDPSVVHIFHHGGSYHLVNDDAAADQHDVDRARDDLNRALNQYVRGTDDHKLVVLLDFVHDYIVNLNDRSPDHHGAVPDAGL